MTVRIKKTAIPVVAALLTGLAGPPAAALDITATWTGAGDGHSYNNAANWDVAVVPVNFGTLIFDVVIPAGGFAVDFNVAGASTVRSLTLGDNSQLKPLTGSDLTVTAELLTFAC